METIPIPLSKAARLSFGGWPQVFRIASLPLLTIDPLPETPDGWRFRLAGMLTARTAMGLKETLSDLLQAYQSTVILDLAGVIRLDAAGLAALADASEHGRLHGVRIVVAHLPSEARRSLALASLHQVIELVED